MHHAHASLTILETVLFDVGNESLTFQKTKILTNISGLLRIIEGIHCLFGECRGRRDASHLGTPVAKNWPWRRALEVTSIYSTKKDVHTQAAKHQIWNFRGATCQEETRMILRSTLETPCFFRYNSTHQWCQLGLIDPEVLWENPVSYCQSSGGKTLSLGSHYPALEDVCPAAPTREGCCIAGNHLWSQFLISRFLDKACCLAGETTIPNECIVQKHPKVILKVNFLQHFKPQLPRTMKL